MREERIFFFKFGFPKLSRTEDLREDLQKTEIKILKTLVLVIIQMSSRNFSP